MLLRTFRVVCPCLDGNHRRGWRYRLRPPLIFADCGWSMWKRSIHSQRACEIHEEAEEEALVHLLVQGVPKPSGMGVRRAISLQDPPLTHADGTDPDLVSPHSTLVAASPSACNEVTDSRAQNAFLEKYITVRRAVALRAGAYPIPISELRTCIEWMCCVCRTYNYCTRRACRRCSSADTLSCREHFPPVRHVAMMPVAWVCEGCGRENDHSSTSENQLPVAIGGMHARERFRCTHCRSLFSGVRKWYCPFCDHINSKASTQCATCFCDRPIAWDCAHCHTGGNSVFQTVCRKCHICRPQKISNSTLRCPTCEAMNDVRWELCEGCMTPLEAMDVSLVASQHPTVTRQCEQYLTQPPAFDSDRSVEDEIRTPAPSGSKDSSGMAVGDMHDECTAVHGNETPHYSRPLGRPVGTSEVDGAWWCEECNVQQRRNANFCDICLQPRVLSSTRAVSYNKGDANGAARESMVDVPGSWQCPYCRQYKEVTVNRCCDHLRDVPQGYWLCSRCCSTNCNARQVCLGCGGPPEAHAWVCLVCSEKNGSHLDRCSRCGDAHPFLWICVGCGTQCHRTDTICSTCEAPKPSLPPPLICPICQAPNESSKKSCFRCRARLSHDTWTCSACAREGNERLSNRCDGCQSPREFDLSEEIWVCEVCSTHVASGGSLPVMKQCPRCGLDRHEQCLHFPSRWRCSGCGVYNRVYASECVDCGQTRDILSLHTTVNCPHCFRLTVLDRKEACGHCHASLSSTLSGSRFVTAMSPLSVDDTGNG